ncbi:MAG: hypothetical protein ABUT20_50000, partial [Bacteroidota bacterium]
MGEENKHLNYTAADIEKYHRGELSAADMHAMEKAALDDPFLADAMEGYDVQHSELKIQNAGPDINDLRKRLAERIEEKKDAPVIKFSWWKVAAVILLIIGAGWLYTSVNSKAKQESLAKNTEAKKETPAPVKPDTPPALAGRTDTVSAAATDVALNEKKQIPKN